MLAARAVLAIRAFAEAAAGNYGAAKPS